MVLIARKIRSCKGVSMVGTLVAVVILLIALIGTSTFRYTAAMDGRRADSNTTAARIALLLCESWRGVNGDQTHDPTQFADPEIAVSQSSWSGHAKPDDFNLLGNYVIVLSPGDPGHVNYYATLSWKDVQPGLRALNVRVAWAQRGAAANGAQNIDKLYGLTVYTQTN